MSGVQKGTPRGSRGVRGVVKVSKGVEKGVRGTPGVKGSLEDAGV